MNTIELLLSHRSVRKFTPQPLAEGQLEQIVRSAQAASSSSFIQCVSVIRVTDPALRQQLAECAGNQEYVASAAEFLVFCIDFDRHRALLSEADPDFTVQSGWTEHLLIGTTDAALMGQNAMVAAESLGLGGCFIGGIRNQVQRVSDLLQLPELVMPLFGLCLGHPDQDPAPKPRLPLAKVLHENAYQPATGDESQAAYEQQIRDYYHQRTRGQRAESWSEQIRAFFSKEARPFMRDYLQRRGFLLR